MLWDYTQEIFHSGLVTLFAYFAIFVIVGIWKTGYFKKNPLDDGDSTTVIDTYSKSEDKSNVLAGSALVALTFIITLFKDQLGTIEPILVFFSLAFVFEVISSFLYHHVTKNIYGYLGMVCQYA